MSRWSLWIVWATFTKPNILTAPKIGIDKRKEILPESNLSNLRILAAVIAIPDLLTPGIKDKIWNAPIIKAAL